MKRPFKKHVWVWIAIVFWLVAILLAAIARGMKGLATLVGLLEVCFWLFAIRLVMQNLTNLGFMASYAAGFAAGTYLGIRIEEYLALGKQGVRIVTRRDATELINALRERNYGVTIIDAEGSRDCPRAVHNCGSQTD